MKHPCRVKGCIAVVTAPGDLCPAHYDSCHLCGFPRRMHPVVQFVEGGPKVRCGQFQHQGMEVSPMSAAVEHPAAGIVLALRDIARYRLPIGDEIRLHYAIERVLPEILPGELVEPEKHLDRFSRIDFYIPRVKVGVEVKVKGSAGDVSRQLARYADSPEIDHLVFVTGRVHLAAMFDGVAQINNKPFTVISVGLLL